MHISPPETPVTMPQEPLQISEGEKISLPEGAKGGREETEKLMEIQKARINAQSAEILKLKDSREKYLRGYKAAMGRIDRLNDELKEYSRIHQEASKEWNQRIRAMEQDLTRTKELLAARSTELSGAQSFLSTADRLSESEVLGLVRDLNENIFQVAANLTDEWEKFRQSTSSYRIKITDNDIEPFSQSYGPTIVRKAQQRTPTAVTFLVQSYLCDSVAQLTSSWRNNEELRVLRSVYNNLSAAEGQAISARWRSLTHSHLSEPPPHSGPIARHIAGILWITGLFRSKDHAFRFVKEKVYSRIENIDRLAVRLESVFMVDITSSDMCLLCETSCAMFDGTRMSEEYESGGDSAPSGQDKVVATTEVGVEKSVRMRGEPQHTQVLLKTKVVLEKDLVDL